MVGHGEIVVTLYTVSQSLKRVEDEGTHLSMTDGKNYRSHYGTPVSSGITASFRLYEENHRVLAFRLTHGTRYLDFDMVYDNERSEPAKTVVKYKIERALKVVKELKP